MTDHPTVKRRPVIARLAYSAAVVMAILYLTDVATARALASEVDGPGATMWQWLLLLGGVTALTGAALSIGPQYRVGTRLESLGAALVAIEVGIYVGTVASTDTLSTRPWATLVWVGLIVPPGLLWRAWEAQQDRAWREGLDEITGADRADR